MIVLIAHLPPNARTVVAAMGSDHEGWDLQAHLIASLIDATNVVAHTTAQVHSKKRLKRPDPLPRPGSTAAAVRRVSVGDLASRAV